VSISPVNQPHNVTPPQAPLPQPVKRDNDGDADDRAGGVKSTPGRGAGGIVDKDA